ncbi:MAG TPA: hypothetical protein PLG59_05670, partial [bacterium]|nr:hypothetical protein [bacterium]
SNMKALGSATMAYQTDHGVFPLHDHTYNCRGLTTPVAYIARVPFDIFQQEGYDPKDPMNARRTRLSSNASTIHPEPFYVTLSGDAAYGQLSVDKTYSPWPGLCARFAQDPVQYDKARGTYPHGRYFVSLGPDYTHDYNPPGVYNPSNGLISYGDIIKVAP